MEDFMMNLIFTFAVMWVTGVVIGLIGLTVVSVVAQFKPVHPHYFEFFSDILAILLPMRKS